MASKKDLSQYQLQTIKTLLSQIKHMLIDIENEITMCAQGVIAGSTNRTRTNSRHESTSCAGVSVTNMLKRRRISSSPSDGERSGVNESKLT